MLFSIGVRQSFGIGVGAPMSAKLKTIDAVVEVDGTVRLNQEIHLDHPVQAVVTLLVEDAETTESKEDAFEAAAEKVFGHHDELFRKLAQSNRRSF